MKAGQQEDGKSFGESSGRVQGDGMGGNPHAVNLTTDLRLQI